MTNRRTPRTWKARWLLVALAGLWAAGGPRRALAQPCVSCWDATCPMLKSYGKPACPVKPGKRGGTGTSRKPPATQPPATAPTPPAEPKPPVAAPAPEPKPPVAAPAPEPCPAGQERGPDTQGRCCWPGQVWDGRCVGLPTACPEGMAADPATQACAPRACAEGRVRASDGVHCCWDGQAWSHSRSVCVGVPASCPGDLEIVAAEQTCRARPCPAGQARGPGGCADVLSWVRVPGGRFQMGEPGIERMVTVGAFELGRTEVTVAAYGACVAAGACTAPGGGDWATWGAPGKEQHPVNYVDWNQARTFCAWAGGRLPTEAEWEYAAHGTDGRTYPWGNAAPGAKLCWQRFNGGGAAAQGTCPVGSYPAGASASGAQDMAGNVTEWVWDVDASYDVLRFSHGGSWTSDEPQLVSARPRGMHRLSTRIHYLGFRCARGASR